MNRDELASGEPPDLAASSSGAPRATLAEARSESRKDWGEARPVTIPRPTIWPAGLAFGITLLMWGLLTSLVLVVAGFLVFVVSLVGWIGELRHEERRT